MIVPFDRSNFPPAPVFNIHISAPGENPSSSTLLALIDTGSDGTIIPAKYLELAEAIGLGDARLISIFGQVQDVHLFEVDIYLGDLVIPGITVNEGEDVGEVILGRNVLNKLILMLDGPEEETVLLDKQPKIK